MSNIVHDKYHRQNHHSFISSEVTDMGLDPIASNEQPFSGEFVMDNADHETWLLSSDRVAFEWVSGYNDVDSLKFDVGISGTNGKTITYPSGNFGNVVIVDGNTDAPALSVVGKSIFTDDIIHNGNLKVSSIDTTSISADTVLISGNDGFALNVTNGSSKFNDVIGGDFTITGNAGVTGVVVVGGNAEIGGDLNVNKNLYFTSGIANGGFLNVAGSAFFGDIKVNGKIEANDYYYNRTTGINVPSDGGWLLSGDMSDAQKELIPGKDAGADTYNPGINNMTLSAIGLSSDSWASFGGNVLFGGDKVYDDAAETIFSNPVYFSTTTAQNLSSNEFSAYNAHIRRVCDEVRVDSLIPENTSGDIAYFNGLTGNIISGDVLSANNAFVDGLTSDFLSAKSALFDASSATYASGTYIIAESGFYLGESPIITPNGSPVTSVLVSATNFAVEDYIYIPNTPYRFSWGDSYSEIKPPGYEKRAINIEYGNKMFSNLHNNLVHPVHHNPTPGTDPNYETEYIQMWGTPSDYSGEDTDLHNFAQWQDWYQKASANVYYVRTDYNGNKKKRVGIKVPYRFAKYSRAIELCFTILADVHPGATIWDLFFLLRQDENGKDVSDYIGLSDLKTPEGGYCDATWMRANSSQSGYVRGLFRIHLTIGWYQCVERLGVGNNKTFMRV